MENQQKIDQLLEKLNVLKGVHSHFEKEIEDLRKEIEALRQTPSATPEPSKPESVEALPKPEVEEKVTPTPAEAPVTDLYRDPQKRILGGVCAGLARRYGVNLALMRTLWILLGIFFLVGVPLYVVLWIAIPKGTESRPAQPASPTPATPLSPADQPAADASKKMDLEKYIGENLISKIGIAVLVIGAGIGVKYSIDHDLISPLVRILLGYVLGISLGVIAYRLRERYENFSAVLLSGSMAILYFMTFAACSFYDMLPPVAAFALMVLITVATVLAALNYNRQFIAHLGLVGAYAVPFLLSEGQDRVGILFTYMAIINAGILVVALKKYWKPLYWVAFALTWIIVLSWYFNSYEADTHYALALGFGSLFFFLFYLTFLGYKLLQKEPFEVSDIILVLINSFVFYGLGYDLLNDTPEWENSLGMYTLFHALIHGAVAFLVFRIRGADKPVFYLVSGLVLVFLTLAIPVQLDGSWVTLLWLGEGVLLFWIGRTQSRSLYEKISYILLGLAFLSLIQDWDAYNPGWFFEEKERFPSLFNITFLGSLIFLGAAGYLNYLHYQLQYAPPFQRGNSTYTLLSIGLSGLLLIVLYFTFSNEISYYWEGRYQASTTDALADSFNSGRNPDFKTLKNLWGMLYFLGYTGVLLWLNIGRIKTKLLGILGLMLASGGLLYFLTIGLYDLSELRESYLLEDVIGEPVPAFYALGMRYLVFGFIAALLWAGYSQLKAMYEREEFIRGFDLILALTLVWGASSELLHLLDLSGAQEQYKLALTIFWGVCALSLSALGIWKAKKHLRVAAIALLGITLIKLFFYDLADLPTLSKAIVFLALGVVLLGISFLYNKFKTAIED
ncbi:phage shock protein C (PspC) family protein [Muriicola jejuensis]|uniref:DUF2339 domain-containing protein n=1 Tax=Muriicola jejuensis TaxID=504488 RepID=A0A6P0UE41_9FLAO|nr:DUF2339 domain-containing protein [Muriicola jejuensis]NER09998.1 DUF2339 domain-containing protein [Muriicola jejuensis]SMP03919.1 phage shock protein C (PspC) family protein [Muriicola jejuensis]